MRLIFVFIIISLSILAGQDMHREIKINVTIKAPVDSVWRAWTTEEGVKSFFAPDCKVELKVGGAYEMYFVPEEEYGKKGGEGNKVLAFQENKMFSFTWNAPPSLPEIRYQLTHVTLYFRKIANDETELILIHDGWGYGGEWDKGFEYFENAWGDIVLPRLQKHFF